jgi:iron complex outermembrane receptor protein
MVPAEHIGIIPRSHYDYPAEMGFTVPAFGVVRHRRHDSFQRERLLRLVAVLALAFLRPAAAEDLSGMALEDLLAVEVEGASRYAQPLSEAPSSVTVIGAQDIRRFGFRTLAEALATAPGVYTSYDRTYTYLGVRGFGRPGDYNSRILLLVDGSRRNDFAYDQAMVGVEAPVEMEWIKRLEFVPGPSSAVYGGNALFGITNAVLWSGADIDGVRLSAEAGSAGLGRAGVMAGRRIDGGDWIAGLSFHRRSGQDLYFSEFDGPGLGDGWARGLDGEKAVKVFAKYAQDGWHAAFGYSDRRKEVPTAYFNSIFGAAGTYAEDGQAYAEVGHVKALAEHWDQSIQFHANDYWYNASYVQPAATNHDETRALNWGADYRLSYTGLQGHKLLLGAEVARTPHVVQRNFDLSPRQDYLDDRRNGDSISVLVQDEWRMSRGWLVNLGVRADHIGGFATDLSPRLALIYNPVPEATIKLMHGRAFRPPNAYERYYNDGNATQKANPELKPEHIATTELAGDWAVTPGVRLTGSVYRYGIDDLVEQITDVDGLTVFRNNPARVHARGMETGAEVLPGAGLRVRGSVALQRVDTPGERLPNSPARLAKLLIDGPLPGIDGTLGFNLQAMSRRRAPAGEVPGHATANLMLRTGAPNRGGEWSLGIYNLFNQRYLDPATVAQTQVALPQDGRQLRLRWEAAY